MADLISKKDIAAVIMEPIVCNLCVVIPDQVFFDIVQEACEQHGTLFIADEVATGFGRTGTIFASEHYDLKPDIMCLGKGITGGYGALGAAITTEAVAQSFAFDFSFYSTFGWHPLNTEAALSNLRYILKHQATLLANGTQVSTYFEKRLWSMTFKHTPEIRIKGLAIGLEFDVKRASYAEEIRTKARNRGLLVTGIDAHQIVMYPPLNMDLKIAKEGLDIFEQAL